MRRIDPVIYLLCAAGVFLILTLSLAWPVGFSLGVLAAALAAAGALALLRQRRLDQAEQALQELERQRLQEQKETAAERERMQQELHSRLESLRSILSHDLRMPISIIQGYAELLHEEVVTDPALQKEYIEKILKRTRYMSESLSRQLTEARQEEYTPPAREPIELLELARQGASDLSNAAATRGISIQVISPEQTLWVNADRHQLSKIFFNLVENSIKYMGREGIITIRILRGDGAAHVTVKDDGMGLDAESTRHIFELYYQGPNRIPGQGHGHGLYLVKRTVEALDGRIEADSQPGQGMTITFTLPLAQAGQPTAAHS